MERIKALNRYQKGILILLAAMLVVFTVLYAVSYARVGFEYAGHILVPREENGSTIYSGTIRGTEAVITVASDQTVTVRYGDRTYGPYTARLDPSAIPAGHDLSAYMTGVEIREGEKVFFRGGVFNSGGTLVLIDGDGNNQGMTFTVIMSDGTELDMNGKPVDRMKPTPGVILELLNDPELTRKGIWIVWVMSAFVCGLTAVTILFADELFRFKMSFRVMNPEYAEPSELEIAGRYIEWTVLTVMALVIFIMGLQ